MRSSEIPLITYTDLKHLFLRHRTKIKKGALFCGLAVFAFLLLKEPSYRVEAAFKQGTKPSEASSQMKEVFQQLLPPTLESGVATTMRSQEVLRDAVETLGLQISPKREFFLWRGLRRIGENLRAELTTSLSDKDPFYFEGVSYSGEENLPFFIEWKGEERFYLLDQTKKKVSEGKIGEPIPFQSAHFTLKQLPRNVQKDRPYGFLMQPWMKVVEGLKKKLDVRPLKTDKNIFHLSFSARDRHFASTFLNQVMLSYQKRLKRENEVICEEQICYLKEREKQLIDDLERAFGDHVTYLVENIGKNGCMGFSQEWEMLKEPKTHYLSKLFQVDVELERLLLGKQPPFSGSLFDKEMNIKKVRGPSHLQRRAPLEEESIQQKLEMPLIAEIQQVDAQISEAKRLLHCLEKGEDLPPVAFLLSDPKSTIAHLVEEIFKPQPDEEKAYSVSCLQGAIEQLELKYEMLSEDLGLQERGSHDFTGLSLETAQKLMIAYTEQKDRLQAEIKELVYLTDHLVSPDFELSSLATFIEGPVAGELIQRAGLVALQLKDESNRTPREQERLSELLTTQKHFLSQYIFQTVDLKKMRMKLLEDKINFLRRRTINLLRSEKDLLGQKLQEINVEMRTLPEKWKRESLLTLKQEMGSMMVQAVSELVENKTWNQKTFQVTSRPLDLAVPPLEPQHPGILLFSLIASLLGGAGSYLFFFCRSLFRGLPVSEENLRLSGLPVLGSLSQNGHSSLLEMREADLETLRRLAEFLAKEEGKVTACVGGKYRDYSKALAEILAMRGKKVLLIECVFSREVEKRMGLWQFLHGLVETPPIYREGGYALLPSGATTRHGAELISSPGFSKLLSEVKSEYDTILLFSDASLTKAEAIGLLKIADRAIVTVQQESKELLAPYSDWAQKQGKERTTFIYAEEFA